MSNQFLAASVTTKRAKALASELDLDLKKVDVIWWRAGIVSELQNLVMVSEACGQRLDSADTPLDLIAAKVALCKLQMYPDYYERLKAMEDEAIVHWRRIQLPASAAR